MYNFSFKSGGFGNSGRTGQSAFTPGNSGGFGGGWTNWDLPHLQRRYPGVNEGGSASPNTASRPVSTPGGETYQNGTAYTPGWGGGPSQAPNPYGNPFATQFPMGSVGNASAYQWSGRPSLNYQNIFNRLYGLSY